MARRASIVVTSALLAGCIPEGVDRTPSLSATPPAPAPLPAPANDPVRALPAPPPAWEARAVVADAQDVPTESYIVQPGDTLRGIADRTGAGAEAIARANALPPPYAIRAGQRLMIPGGRYHRVRAGETGIAIARAYGVDWSRIVTANALAEPYILRTGQRIAIPRDAAPATLAERARAFQIDIDDILTGGEPALAENQSPARPAATPARVLPSTAAVAQPARMRGGFQWPVDGPIISRFGASPGGVRNNGVKIAVPLSTPILAAADGVVAYAGSDIPSLGGVVILRHGDGLTSVYGHAAQLLVQRSQSVKRGQTLALSGDSGAADRPALHFELRQGRIPVDPATRLPARS
jgi:lipoprotein NlpD